MANINSIIRPINDFDENPLFTDVVWSDPTDNEEGWFRENQRGRGHSFNGAAVVNFLKKNSLQRIIRAHQCVKNGTEEFFNQKVITVFSASSYCKPMSNRSGLILLFQNNNNIEYYNLDPLLRLSKADAQYYKVQALDEKEKQHPRCFSINPARITIKCSSPSLSTIKLLSSSTDTKNSSNRSRIPHYNSAIQGEINLDIWKTPMPKKPIINPSPIARNISRSIINTHISQGKRKTHDFIQNIHFGQINQSKLISNEIMSRSASIPGNLYHISQNDNQNINSNINNNNSISNNNNNDNNNINNNNNDNNSISNNSNNIDNISNLDSVSPRRQSLPENKINYIIEDDNDNYPNQIDYLNIASLPKLKSTA